MLTRSVSSSRNSPAIANVWPSPTSMPVDARRVRKPGAVVPDTAVPSEKSTWLTSVVTSRWMRSSLSTVGVNATPTPNSLYSTVIRSRLDATGTATSPPARNRAVSPVRATSVGVARILPTPFSSSAIRNSS